MFRMYCPWQLFIFLGIIYGLFNKCIVAYVCWLLFVVVGEYKNEFLFLFNKCFVDQFRLFLMMFIARFVPLLFYILNIVVYMMSIVVNNELFDIVIGVDIVN